MSAATVPRIVRCPHCGGPSVYSPDRPWRPFCSPRCKSADLGAWSSAEYRVGAGGPAATDDDNGAASSDDGG